MRTLTFALFFVFFLLSCLSMQAQPILTGELIINSVNENAIEMHLLVQNIGNETFYYVFSDSETHYYSIDGIEYHDVVLPVVLPFSLSAGASISFEMYHNSPLSYGNHWIQGFMNAENDQGLPFFYAPPVMVTIGGTEAITIGAGDQFSRIPIDFYWRTSLYECLFTAEELNNCSGEITSLSFYNNFTDDSFIQQNIQIALAQTNQSDLAAGWFDPGSLQTVFTGLLDFPLGQHEINIPLNPTFHYNGISNLVLVVHRPIHGSYQVSADPFKVNVADSLRVRKYRSDSYPYGISDPPPANASQHLGFMPKTTFYIIPGPVENGDNVAPIMPQASLHVFPNPFQTEAKIRINMPEKGLADLTVYNLKGQKISTIFQDVKAAGEHEAIWLVRDEHGRKLATGIYLLALKTNSGIVVKKMMVLP